MSDYVTEKIRRQMQFIRTVEDSLRKSGKDTVRNEKLIDCKREVRHLISKDDVRDVIMYFSRNGERCRQFFTVPWKGDKEDLRKYLWATEADYIYSDYDCTGRWFTSSIYVGRLQENVYYVCIEDFLDV